MEIVAISLGALSFGLVCLLVYQQFFFMKHIQTLTDKAMSRSFQEYQSAQKPVEKRVQISEDAPDDLRVLQGFQM